MCGIAGIVGQVEGSKKSLEMSVRAMTLSLRHRGPDAEGVWLDPAKGIALGHRRLSILDLSPSGAQPMVSACGRYVISFNGEIYNFRNIKEMLVSSNSFNTPFRGTSDTEVLLAALAHWGIEHCLTQLNGMFAMAVWDREKEELHLVRDRFGKKPLYFSRLENGLVFGSELKAILQCPQVRQEIDRRVLELYFHLTYIPAPYTIYKNIFKLKPSTRVVFSTKNNSIIETSYWSSANLVSDPNPTISGQTFHEAIESLESLLSDAVRIRMVSDVPLGAFLSGGIDSSLVVALMQKISQKPVKTFTIGFWEKKFDEAPIAKQVAHHLGTEHTELYLQPQDALNVIPKLSTLYDEPFADSSQIPTYLVSRLARQQVTVALSGDGGDELFCGYNRYFIGQTLHSKLSWIPPGLGPWVGNLLSQIPNETWVTTLTAVQRRYPGLIPFTQPSHKLQKLAQVLKYDGSRDGSALYREMIGHWHPKDRLVLETLGEDLVSKHYTTFRNGNFTEAMMFSDINSYLPEDILTKVDRASMGESLEVRTPFLDMRVAQLAWSLPLEYKLRGKKGKQILREILGHYIPVELIDRPKMGFGVPIGNWLRHELRDWAENLLSEKQLKEQGFLNVPVVQQKWKEHLSLRSNWEHYLWPVLIFQDWYLAQHRDSRMPFTPESSTEARRISPAASA